MMQAIEYILTGRSSSDGRHGVNQPKIRKHMIFFVLATCFLAYSIIGLAPVIFGTFLPEQILGLPSSYFIALFVVPVIILLLLTWHSGWIEIVESKISNLENE